MTLLYPSSFPFSVKTMHAINDQQTHLLIDQERRTERNTVAWAGIDSPDRRLRCIWEACDLLLDVQTVA